MPGPRRLHCVLCLRPEAGCICRWIRPVNNPIELLVLQHPLEVNEAKGSARLLALSLSRCTLRVGEQFSSTDFGAMDGTALLYPAAEGDDAPVAASHAIKRLILLDATWRKSRKMLHLNPWLRQLPRLALLDPPSSRYGALRRAHQGHQLSTLEAGVLALQQLEGELAAGRYTPLLDAFGGFVSQHMAHNYNPAP